MPLTWATASCHIQPPGSNLREPELGKMPFYALLEECEVANAKSYGGQGRCHCFPDGFMNPQRGDFWKSPGRELRWPIKRGFSNRPVSGEISYVQNLTAENQRFGQPRFLRRCSDKYPRRLARFAGPPQSSPARAQAHTDRLVRGFAEKEMPAPHNVVFFVPCVACANSGESLPARVKAGARRAFTRFLQRD